MGKSSNESLEVRGGSGSSSPGQPRKAMLERKTIEHHNVRLCLDLYLEVDAIRAPSPNRHRHPESLSFSSCSSRR
jgi:hypothetical protein